MNEIIAYNNHQSETLQAITDVLMEEFNTSLSDSTSKIFHRNPAWFLNDNPIVGYYVPVKNDRVIMMFWSGQSFDEPDLEAEGSFKAATKTYSSVDDIDINALRRWLEKSKTIQWDYGNIVKHKGVLEKLTDF